MAYATSYLVPQNALWLGSCLIFSTFSNLTFRSISDKLQARRRSQSLRHLVPRLSRLDGSIKIEFGSAGWTFIRQPRERSRNDEEDRNAAA